MIIGKDKYLQSFGLFVLAVSKYRELEDVISELNSILELDDSHISDAIYGFEIEPRELPFRKLLKRADIHLDKDQE